MNKKKANLKGFEVINGKTDVSELDKMIEE